MKIQSFERLERIPKMQKFLDQTILAGVLLKICLQHCTVCKLFTCDETFSHLFQDLGLALKFHMFVRGMLMYLTYIWK